MSTETEQLTLQLFAKLNVDTGTAGSYEFQGDDFPVNAGESIVREPFDLTGLQAPVSVGNREVKEVMLPRLR